MPKYNQIVIFIIFACLGNIYANTNLSADSDDLLSLSKSPPRFPSCSQKDGYWFEQSGDDYVVNSTMTESEAYIRGNSLTGQKGGVHYINGNVTAYKGNQTMTADWLIYNQANSRAVAGNVILTRQYDVMTGKWSDYSFDLSNGIIKDASAKNAMTNMYVEAKQIKIFNKDKYRAENGFFTTCDPKNPAWHITSKTTEIDYQDSQGVARHATFYIESMPVAYSPYFQFPLGKRRSGFLMPEIGVLTSASYPGANMFVGTPFYWNMSSDYDMTIEPKYYSLSGFMLTDQFRYLTENGNGQIYTEQMPRDQQMGEYRYYWNMFDNHTIASDWTVGYMWSSVSDNNYFVDFGNANSFVDNINLERSAYLRYKPNWGLFDVMVRGYETLNPTDQPAPPQIYSVLPQINFNLNPLPLGDTKLQLGLNSQYTNFTSHVLLSNNSGGTPQTALQDGQRVFIYPSLAMSLQAAWGYITPKLGYSFTGYQLEPYSGFYSNGGEVSRQLPIMSVDSTLYFDQPINWLGNSFIQTLEPRLYYLYIPQFNQANLPVFDTAVATPSLTQLFSENRFSGYDRINSANDITMGLTSRILNDNTGTELVNWGLGYRYYITPENNLLYGSYTQFGQLYQPSPNLIAELNNNWADNISTAAILQYDSLFQNVDGYSLQVNYKPEKHKLLNARYSYQYQMPVFYYSWSPGQVYTPNFYEN
ncbi:MAG: LPS assembly protein LptD, partial [Burkholderiales bacterium]|nr:LPS assembly protein LptD [Burkholderiales bacterium]